MGRLKNPINQEDLEVRENLAGFFRVLLQVDSRVNQHLYEHGPDSIVSYQDNNI